LSPIGIGGGHDEDELVYDESLAFRANCEILKAFCDVYGNDPRLEGLLKGFVDVLLKNASGRFSDIKEQLIAHEGTAAYRNLMLACLMASDGPPGEIADLVWEVATRREEDVLVRRTASYLTNHVDNGKKRSESLLSLLLDSDNDVVVSALVGASRHIDDRCFEIIRTELLTREDVHVRLAAINAIGSSQHPSKQSVLHDVVFAASTSKETAFSEESLTKRAAIQKIDMRESDVFQFVRSLALNENEDAGVRAKAIARFDPKVYPDEQIMLRQLLKTTPSDDVVVLRSVVDTLLKLPSPDNLDAVNSMIASIQDEQVKTLFLYRVGLATK